MAKKKKSRRKAQHKVHRTSRASQPTSSQPAPPAVTATSPAAATVASASATPVSAGKLSPAPAIAASATTISASTSARWVYVRQDLRRVAIFALVSIALEAVAWVILNHTSVGPSLFNSLKI